MVAAASFCAEVVTWASVDRIFPGIMSKTYERSINFW